MDKLEVLSRTQRIIVEHNEAKIVVQLTPIKIVNSGTIGPRGFPGPEGASDSATGAQLTPALIWIMQHDLEFFPAGIKFHSLDGEIELEPQILTYVNNNRILATWPEPTAGTWMIS